MVESGQDPERSATDESLFRRENPALRSPSHLSGKNFAAIMLGLFGIMVVFILPVPILSIIGLLVAHAARHEAPDPDDRKMNNLALGLNWAGLVIAFVFWMLFLLLSLQFLAFN